MGRKIIIIIGVAVLVMLALFMFNGPGSQSVSPNILYITQPVNSFSGQVEKIEGNTILVSSQYSLPQTASIMITVMPGQSVVMPPPQIKTITYKLLVTDKTQINQPATPVNYLLKTATPAPMAKLTIKDIKVGQNITVNSQADLRTLSGNTFEATMISLPQITNTLNGQIINLEGNILTVKEFASVMAPLPNPGMAASSAPQEKEYRINITSDTEISRPSFILTKPGETPQSPKNEKLAPSDLKKDMQVMIYTAEDVTKSQTLTALRIEPAQVIPSAVPISPTLLSPTLSPTPSASASPSIKP